MKYLEEKINEILWDVAKSEGIESMEYKATKLKELIDDIAEDVADEFKKENKKPVNASKYIVRG